METRVVPQLRPMQRAHALLAAVVALGGPVNFRMPRTKSTKTNRYTPCECCGKLTRWSQCFTCAEKSQLDNR